MKIADEKKAVGQMIALYCRKNHHRRELCPDCLALKKYAFKRLDHCRYGNQKKACSKCRTSCYQPEKKAQIKSVMRFSGPRMLIYDPRTAVKHLLNR